MKFSITRIKIKHILGVVLLLLLAFIGLRGYEYFVTLNTEVEEVRVTNLTSNSVTISWTTNKAVRSKIQYSSFHNSKSRDYVAYDDRDLKITEDGDHKLKGLRPQARKTHHITLYNLDADSEYQYNLQMNGYNLNAFANQVTTLPLVDQLTTPETAYGKITATEKSENFEGIMYYKVLADDNPGTKSVSATYSTIINAGGNWSVDLSQVTDNLGKKFNWNEKYFLSVEAKTTTGNIYSVINIEDRTPFPTLTINPGQTTVKTSKTQSVLGALTPTVSAAATVGRGNCCGVVGYGNCSAQAEWDAGWYACRNGGCNCDAETPVECIAGWSCNGACADAGTRDMFNGTFCDGQARWLYEAGCGQLTTQANTPASQCTTVTPEANATQPPNQGILSPTTPTGDPVQGGGANVNVNTQYPSLPQRTISAAGACGVNVDPANPNGYPREQGVARLKELGPIYVRLVYKAGADGAIQELVANGLSPVVIFNHESFPTDWGWQTQGPQATAQYAEKFRVFARDTANKLGGSVAAIEIWNEPDDPVGLDLTPDQFGAVLAAGATGVKEAPNSRAIVISGGLAHSPEYLGRTVAARSDALKNVDAVGIHLYTINADAATGTFSYLLGYKNQVWVTEFSWLTVVPEQQAGDFINNWYSTIRNKFGNQVPVSILYAWNDAMQCSNQGNNCAGGFGLTKHAPGQPAKQPVYNTFASVCGGTPAANTQVEVPVAGASGNSQLEQTAGLLHHVSAAGNIETNKLDKGVYEIQIPGQEKEILFLQTDNNEIIFYQDLNGDKVRQDAEPIVDAGQRDVKISQVSEISSYDLNVGWNLLGFDLTSREWDTAAKLLTEIRSQGISAPQIATFQSGKWQVYTERIAANGELEVFGDDFPILPGRGVFVKSHNKAQINLSGQKFESSVPIFLNNGWNLASIQSPDEYTAKSLISKCAEVNSCPIVARFDSGLYQIFVKDNEIYFGNDFPVVKKSSYFIKVENTEEVEFVP